MQHILDKAIEAVKEAGEFQLRHFRNMPPGSGDAKKLREMVSFVDVESEQMLRESLIRLVPDAGFYGEETAVDRKSTEWIVDPIDGTTNYLSGLAQFSISVALYCEGRPQLGIVYQPATGDLFTAIKGRGFHHNGTKCLKSTPELAIGNALIGTGFPYRSEDLQNKFFKCAKEVLNRSRGIRRMGSAALDLSYLAAGYLQGFWESDLQPYDVGAAILFMEETGIQVTNIEGKAYNPECDRIIVAGFPKVQPILLQSVSRHYS